MKQRCVVILMLGGALIFAAPAQAQDQRYVGEDGVELYDSPTQDANIVTMLVKGAALEVLDFSAAGYTHVRTADDWEGFVVNQYLTDSRPPEAEPTANLSLSTAAVPAQKTTAAIVPMTKGEPVVVRTSEHKPVKIASDKPRAISAEMKLVNLQKELTAVNAQNQQLTKESNRNWFLAGAGVLVLGFLIGLIVPKIQWRRKSWHSY